MSSIFLKIFGFVDFFGLNIAYLSLLFNFILVLFIWIFWFIVYCKIYRLIEYFQLIKSKSLPPRDVNNHHNMESQCQRVNPRQALLRLPTTVAVAMEEVRPQMSPPNPIVLSLATCSTASSCPPCSVSPVTATRPAKRPSRTCRCPSPARTTWPCCISRRATTTCHRLAEWFLALQSSNNNHSRPRKVSIITNNNSNNNKTNCRITMAGGSGGCGSGCARGSMGRPSPCTTAWPRSSVRTS